MWNNSNFVANPATRSLNVCIDTITCFPDILYEDDTLILLHKPAGLLVHPSWISPASTPNLVGLLKQRYPDETFHTIHRLDRATSGVILFVRNDKEAARVMHQQFIDRQVSKTYLCVVRGWTEAEGTIDYPLRYEKDHYAEPFANADKAPQEAVTHYRTLAQVELPIAVGRYPVARYSLLEVKPETGRKHQIRRHMKHILHPLAGDTKYGEGRHNRLFREHFSIRRLLLMATELQFVHPREFRKVHVTATPDAEVLNLFEKLGWSCLADLSENPQLLR